MDEATFEKIVGQALDSIHPEFQHYLNNVDVVIEPSATQEQLRSVGLDQPAVLYGLYQGVPLTRRGTHSPSMPDRITIFREPALQHYQDEDGIRSHVLHTILHEIAHFFGISDDRLHELGAY